MSVKGFVTICILSAMWIGFAIPSAQVRANECIDHSKSDFEYEDSKSRAENIERAIAKIDCLSKLIDRISKSTSDLEIESKKSALFVEKITDAGGVLAGYELVEKKCPQTWSCDVQCPTGKFVTGGSCSTTGPPEGVSLRTSSTEGKPYWCGTNNGENFNFVYVKAFCAATIKPGSK